MKLNSIFSRLFILLIVFTLFLVGALWTFQILFLPDYYQNEKVEIIKSSISEIDEMVQKENLNDQSIEKIVDTVERINGRIIVYDKKGKILFQEGSQGMIRETRISEEQVNQVLAKKDLVYTTNNVRGNNEFLAVLTAGKNNIYLFLTPYQAIDDAISITRGFYLFLALGGILIASILAYIFAERITKPLIKLNSLASNIATLNFSDKWKGNRQDEIGQLGISLNKVSDNLKTTLRDLQDELEKEKNLDKLRKNFVSRVSHELQTPIAIINGHIEALNDGIPETEQEKVRYLTIIENETNKMSKLIKDLLDLTQLESGNFKIKKNVLDYSELLINKIKSFELLFKEKNLEIVEDLHSDQIILNGDEYRLDQVLNNLIQNAVNNTKNNRKIIIKTKEENDYIRTEIFNEGTKIPEEIMPFIWESFFKGEEKKGTGIGLAVVKNIVNLHNGQTGVINMENGVMFYFNIPK